MKKIKELASYKVDQYGLKNLQTVDPLSNIEECQNIMKDQNIHHLPVEKAGKVIGLISHRDLQVVSNKHWAEKLQAQDLMQKDVHFVPQDSDLASVTAAMLEHQIGSVLIEDKQKKVVGIFTTTDALRALHDVMGVEVAQEKKSIIFY